MRLRRTFLAVLVVCGMTTACTAGGSNSSTPEVAPTIVPAEQADYSTTKYIYGSVTALPDVIWTPQVEINGKRFDLADVMVAGDGCDYMSQHERAQRVRQLLEELAPVGSEVVGLLAYSNNVIYLHRAPAVGPSINEILIRSGWVQTSPDHRGWNLDWEELETYVEAAASAEAASRVDPNAGWAQCQAAEATAVAAFAELQAATRREMEQWEQRARTGAQDPTVSWGDGRCSTCRVARRVFGSLF